MTPIKPRPGRRDARAAAVQLLCALDANPDSPTAAGKSHLKKKLAHSKLEEFAWNLVEGVRREKAVVDALLAASAENWTLHRMPMVDRNILRVAVFEMCVDRKIDAAVAINEAVEIGKAFSTAEAPRFINGVLDRVARRNDVRVDRTAAPVEAATETEVQAGFDSAESDE
ncbi:MAG: transcription antitermination factor NusB [Planctomycetia bacterium]